MLTVLGGGRRRGRSLEPKNQEGACHFPESLPTVFTQGSSSSEVSWRSDCSLGTGIKLFELSLPRPFFPK